MRKLTFLAVAFAAGVTGFAANSELHASQSLRGDGFEKSSAAKKADKAVAKDESQPAAKDESQEKAAAKNDKPGTLAARRGAEEVVKTPLFASKKVDKVAAKGEEATAKNDKPAMLASRRGAAQEIVKTPLFGKKSDDADSKNAAEEKPAAEKKPSETRQVAKKATPKVEKVAEKSAPKAKQIAKKSEPKVEQVAKKKIAEEPIAIDLFETASIGGKGAKSVKGFGGQYSEIIAQYASSYGVPLSLAHAVIQVESNYRPNARGSAGEIGLMQIKPSTARMMGYSGSTQALFDPATNIKYGMKYLAKAHSLGGGTTCGTILKYNAGHGARRMNPVSSAYCSKVKRHLGV